ncbi:MAG TPA: carboxypeptidase-like regulatory domain-containing protein [Pirellulales bacterium]|nr:carboxypeptidase-like regulatory domain-containing protein [Pirellulales bacterium]
MIQRPARSQTLWSTILAVSVLLLSGPAAGAAEPTVLRGRVLLPDGKPAAGAGIYWLQFKAPPPRKPEDVVFEKRAATDDEGRFEFSLLEHDAPLDKQQPRPLVAYLQGYGVDWVEIVQDQVPNDAALRLVDDHPVRGRVADTEGRHVAGAKISAAKIVVPPSGKLDDFLEAWTKRGTGNRFQQQLSASRQLFASRLLPFLATVTDRDGRFELSGIGAERLASVSISAPGLVSDQLEVVNREGFEADKYNQAAQAGMVPMMRRPGMLPRLTGPVFDHIAEIELVVRGVVFTGPDRKPVAKAVVGASGGGMNLGGGSNPISAQADEQGAFELRGLRRSQGALLSVYAPRGSNLLFRALQLDLAPGQTVVNVEVEMKEGIVVEGRVFDQATGRGVNSGVHFVPLPGNEYFNQPGYGSKVMGMASNLTDDEGQFRLLVMPGPLVLMAQVQRGRPGILVAGPPVGGNEPIPYRQASFSEEDSKRVPVTVDGDDRYFAGAYGPLRFLMGWNAVKVIDSAPGSGPISCDLPLDPGKTATISIEDEQGQPVTDAFVGGVADCWPITAKTAEPRCTIYGLGADRPRHVCVFQPQRHLAGSATLTGDEQGPVTIRLSPTASIAGRALDADGEPLADALLQFVYLRRSAWDAINVVGRDQAPLKTDADGRFRAENILPGERLTLSFRQGDKFFGGPRITDEKRQLAPGEKLNLVEFRAKELQ